MAKLDIVVDGGFKSGHVSNHIQFAFNIKLERTFFGDAIHLPNTLITQANTVVYPEDLNENLAPEVAELVAIYNSLIEAKKQFPFMVVYGVTQVNVYTDSQAALDDIASADFGIIEPKSKCYTDHLRQELLRSISAVVKELTGRASIVPVQAPSVAFYKIDAHQLPENFSLTDPVLPPDAVNTLYLTHTAMDNLVKEARYSYLDSLEENM